MNPKNLLLATLLLTSFSGICQSLVDINFSYLAAIKGNEVVVSHVPTQIALMPREQYYDEANETLRDHADQMLSQADQHLRAQNMAEMAKEIRQVVSNLEQQRKELNDNLEMQRMVDEQLAIFKQHLADTEAEKADIEPFVQTPAQITKELLSIALNHRFYSDARLLDNGTWLVCEGILYNDDADDPTTDGYFRYGIIDENGRTLIPSIYHFRGMLEQQDIYFVQKKAGTKVLAGAVDGHGNVKITFDYADCRSLDSQYGLVLIESSTGKYGVVTQSGRQILPAIYDDYFAADNGYNFIQGDKVTFVDNSGKVQVKG